MFGSRQIEKNRKPLKFRDNKERDPKSVKKLKPVRDPRYREEGTTNDYQQRY
jgi:hypothetical protein